MPDPWASGEQLTPERLNSRTVEPVSRLETQVGTIPVGDAPRTTGASFAVFKVTSSSQVGSGDQWEYTATRQSMVKTGTGYGAWQDHPTDSKEYTLRALAEDSEATESAIPDDTIVLAARMGVSGSPWEWWIVGAPNGTPICDTPEPEDGDILRWNAEDECWEPVTPVEIQVVTDVSVSGNTIEQSKKTLKVIEEVSDDGSSTVHTGVSC